MKIYLTGFMGTGKTYTGRRLAAVLGFAFLDLDEAIATEQGCSVAEIFQTEGEARFRELEKRALRATETLGRTVIACGGGTPCYEDNMQWMNEQGVTVWLKVPAEELYRRLTAHPEQRPLLAGLQSEAEWMQFLQQKLSGREPWYRQAQITVERREKGEDSAALLAAQLHEKFPDFF
ncbi:MAG: shikimate kinase [Saprospiraceae bacterium]|nr:shikimate kinase [Saprospiraceae bacterium]